MIELAVLVVRLLGDKNSGKLAHGCAGFHATVHFQTWSKRNFASEFIFASKTVDCQTNDTIRVGPNIGRRRLADDRQCGDISGCRLELQ